MSYARFGAEGSDVYVFHSVWGYYECCGCGLRGRGKVPSVVRTPAEMLAHLKEHRDAGHCVPQSAIDELREEAKELGS